MNIGVIFWNIALDQNSSPKLQGVDTTATNRGLLTIRSDVNDSVTFEAGYYSIGHMSKFVEPGASRIGSNNSGGDVEAVAFQNPDKSIVLVLSNRVGAEREVKFRWAAKSAKVRLPPLSAATLKWRA